MDVLLKRSIVSGFERLRVAEIDTRGVPGALGTRCLICETDRAIRRIWNYPADWSRIEDGKLLALFDAPIAARAAGAEPRGHTATAIER